MTDDDRQQLEHFAHLVKGDPWAAADYLAERFPVERYPRSVAAHTGLHVQLEHLAADLEHWYDVKLKAATLRVYRATALAWPHEDRSSSATYRAHELLRGKADRREQLDRYVKRAAEREHAPVLGERHLRRYLAEGRPARQVEPPQLLDALDKAARRFLRAERGVITTRPDWWNVDRLSDADRAELADWLEATAKDIRGA